MNYHWDDFKNKVKYAADIEEIISRYVNLKRAGRKMTGLCPFHLEKTPSFVVYTDSQSFHCFGCRESGDVITFVMKQENLEYAEAVRFLAQVYSIPVPEKDDSGHDFSFRQRILDANIEAARFFHQNLLNEQGKDAFEYLTSRGISHKTIVAYGIGYAADSWDSLKNHLFDKKFTMRELTAANLVVRSQKGTYYDQFRNRVIFPIMDLRKNVIAFGGRVLDDSKPKYLNSSETPVFKKRSNLYALNLAKDAKTKTFILAEGYMDVIAMYQAGFKAAVAALGTAFTAEQAKQLKKYADEVVIAYDSDEAGIKASNDASELLSKAGMNVRMLELKDAKDPDEYIKKYGREKFALLLTGSADIFSYKLAQLRRIYDISSIEGKTKYIRECVKLLTKCFDPIEREVCAAKIAEETEMSKATILESAASLMMKNAKAKKTRERREMLAGKEHYLDRTSPEKAGNLKQATAEENLIWFIVKNPECYESAASKLKQDDFVTSWGKSVFTSLKDVLESDTEQTQGPLELIRFSGIISEEHKAKLSEILAKRSEFVSAASQADDYINALVTNKNKKDDKALEAMEPEEILSYQMEKYKKRVKRGV